MPSTKRARPIKRSPASKLVAAPREAGTAPLQTLGRGLQILKYIASQPQLVRLRDVAQAFDLERSVALRLLQSLEAEGFVTKHEGLKAYSLGPALDELARPKPFIERLVERVRPLLAELSTTTGQTSHLAVLEGQMAVLVEVRQASGPIIVQQAPGEFEALYCSAVGKAIFAFLPVNERSQLLAQMKFVKHKPATLRTAEQLQREAEIIRKTGIAFDRDEGPLPLKCLAAPVINENGRPIASVGISSIAALMPRPIDEMTAWIAAVRRCAKSISAELDA